MQQDNRGIVVLGFPRSGTTLLRRLLDAHPNIACPGETCLLSACARFLHTEIVSDGLEFGVLNGLAFAGVTHDDTLRRLREFAFSFHEEYAKSQSKVRWAEKTAIDAFYLDEIERLCGDQVQYVCVVRHGLDVACSVQELSDRGYTYLSEIHDYVKDDPRPLEAFAQAWKDVNSRLVDFVARQGENALLLKYEQLTEHPRVETAKLFDFLGEQLHDDLIETATGDAKAIGLGDWKTFSRTEIDTASVNRWKRLPPYVISRLAEICNPVLETLGYEPVSTRNPGSQSAARRRYELGMLMGASKKPDQKS